MPQVLLLAGSSSAGRSHGRIVNIDPLRFLKHSIMFIDGFGC